MSSQFLICISRDLSMEAAILFCCHLVLRWYGRQRVLLQRHSSSFAYHVTSPWRLPCCFAAMLFCADTITRRCCGGKVEGQLMTSQFLICMSRDLSMESVILLCCHVVLITRRHCGARSKIKDHRPFVLIRLPVRVRVSHTNSDVCSEP